MNQAETSPIDSEWWAEFIFGIKNTQNSIFRVFGAKTTITRGGRAGSFQFFSCFCIFFACDRKPQFALGTFPGQVAVLTWREATSNPTGLGYPCQESHSLIQFSLLFSRFLDLFCRKKNLWHQFPRGSPGSLIVFVYKSEHPQKSYGSWHLILRWLFFGVGFFLRRGIWCQVLWNLVPGFVAQKKWRQLASC